MKANQEKALQLVENGNWEKANEVLGGCGIEYVSCGEYELKYINVGDTYTTTVCQEMPDGKPFIGSWGIWYELVQEKVCEENDVRYCPYCGEYTSIEGPKCEYCGN